MDKVRYAGDLSQEDAPDLLQAFPEQEPNVEDEILEPSQVTDQANTCKQNALATESGDKIMNKLQCNHSGMLDPKIQHTTHRYSLRSR